MKPAMGRRMAEWQARGLAATVSSDVVGSTLVMGCGFTLPRSTLVDKNALWAGVVRACTRACSHCASRGSECEQNSRRWDRSPSAVGPAGGVFGEVSAPLVDHIREGGWVMDETGAEGGGWEFLVCGM